MEHWGIIKAKLTLYSVGTHDELVFLICFWVTNTIFCYCLEYSINMTFSLIADILSTSTAIIVPSGIYPILVFLFSFWTTLTITSSRAHIQVGRRAARVHLIQLPPIDATIRVINSQQSIPFISRNMNEFFINFSSATSTSLNN